VDRRHYVKSREAGRIVSKAVINSRRGKHRGCARSAGNAVNPSEAETFWTDFLRSLTRRGLRGVKLVISDAHEGLKAAAAKVSDHPGSAAKVHLSAAIR